MKYFPLPHRTSQAFGFADRQVADGFVAVLGGACGCRPLIQFLNHRLLTRGVSNVGDAMTSNQQNPHWGGTNGG